MQRQIRDIENIKSAAQNTIDTCPTHEYVEQHAAIAESVTCELGKDCKAPLDLNTVIGKARFRINHRVKLGTVTQVKLCNLAVEEKLGLFFFGVMKIILLL